jgi:outer-membrane receptor for ferric coprogen and ferric-rhodotorulic acid
MKFRLLPLSAAILLGLHSQLGVAQGTAKDAATKKDSNSLEEVIVTGKYSVDQTKALDTATGLGLTIAETPQSVSVLTFERMQDQKPSITPWV